MGAYQKDGHGSLLSQQPDALPQHQRQKTRMVIHPPPQLVTGVAGNMPCMPSDAPGREDGKTGTGKSYRTHIGARAALRCPGSKTGNSESEDCPNLCALICLIIFLIFSFITIQKDIKHCLFILLAQSPQSLLLTLSALSAPFYIHIIVCLLFSFITRQERGRSVHYGRPNWNNSGNFQVWTGWRPS